MINSNFKWAFLAGGAVLLTGVIALQVVRFYVTRPSAPFSFDRSLGSLPNGWKVADLPLSGTEDASKAAINILQFDEFVHKRFTKSDREFTLFATTYAPRSVPVDIVAQHTPDACWPSQGMSVTKSESDKQFYLGKQALPPGEWRTFSTSASSTIEVVFWHTIGGFAVAKFDYGRYSRLRAVYRQFYEPSNRQFFVRISSGQPLEGVLGDREVAWLLHGIMTSALKLSDEP
jgi:hypothetical protein